LERHTKRSAEKPELHNIDPAFATFTFADEGLSLSDAASEVHLGETSSAPGVSEDAQEHGVLGRVNRLFHRARDRNGLG
jgi:hypothetical protein